MSENMLRLAVDAVLEADREFRSNMPPEWDGDPLSSELDGLRRIFEATPAPLPISVGWQTIETAPTDGRDLILTHPDWNGSFAFGKWRERPSPDGASMIPTHWMHIPPLTPATAPAEHVVPAGTVVGLIDWNGTKASVIDAVLEARSAVYTQPSEHVVGLSIAELQRAHVERQEEWCPDQKPDLSFRGNELGGECGEAQNVIKKLERERHGWRGSRDTVEHLAEELGDVIHCAVLCAITAGIDLEPAVIAKFNSTSEKNGLATRLRAALSASEVEG